MRKTNEQENHGKMVLYRTKDGRMAVDVRLEKDTLWLTQKEMSVLFATERSVVTKHLRNIFQTGELKRESNVQKMHIAGSDKPVVFYSLDAIISVGYRVNSRRGTDFGGRDLYPSVEEKAAHLLYFIIKDHPFADGNKRIGSLLFIIFLSRNNFLLRKNGEKKINDNALVALPCLLRRASRVKRM